MEDIVVILNPAARSEKAVRERARIEALPGCQVRVTRKAGDGRELAAEAIREGFRTIVAAGGDGSINDVVNGMVGGEASLGILPVGTMNVFAAEMGIPNDLNKAWKVIRAGNTRKIDLCQANEQYFVQLAGVGLDAQVVASTTTASKNSFGPLSYLFSAAQIAGRKPPKLIVETEETQREGSFVLVGNGRYYGGPLAFFKDARVDDGKLDVLIFKNMSYLDLARYLGTVLMGRHTDLADVTYFQTTKALVRSVDNVPVEVDGELSGQVPVQFQIAQSKLKVLVPG